MVVMDRNSGQPVGRELARLARKESGHLRVVRHSYLMSLLAKEQHSSPRFPRRDGMMQMLARS